jgi:hypothetical protein
MTATLIVCAILAAAATNAAFGRNEQRTPSIAERHPWTLFVFWLIVIWGVWVNL